MANLNKVMLIGRLTFDPEPIQSGGATIGAKIAFAVSNRRPSKTNPQQWEDVPVFIDVEVWNRGESKQADRVLATLRRGSQIYIEGHLKLDEWNDKVSGDKRTKLVVVAETFQYLESKQEGEARLQQPPAPRFAGRQQGQQAPQPTMARTNGGSSGYSRPNGGGYNGGNGGGGNYDDGADYDAPASQPKKGGSDDDIPF
jgi:single-strand DNA-binding protein